MSLHLSADPAVYEICGLFLERASGDVCERMRKHREQVLAAFCEEHGAVKVSALKPFHLKLWAEARTNIKSGWSRRSWISAVKACFGWAHSLGIIDRQPFARVTSAPGKRGRPLKEEEFQAIMRHADPDLRRFLVFLRFTGCRPGEASKARWADLRVEQAALVIAEHKTVKKTGQPRTIYLHPVCLKLLAWLGRMFGTVRENLIFTSDNGGAWKNSARSQRILKIRKAAGLPRDAKYYGARHAFATRAIINGVEIKTLATLMGHSQVATTEIYTHIVGQHEHLSAAVKDVFSSGEKA